MIKPEVKKQQLESLQKTTSTKKQIIEKIAETSLDDFTSIVPSLAHNMTKEDLVTNASAILNGKKDSLPFDRHCLAKL